MANNNQNTSQKQSTPSNITPSKVAYNFTAIGLVLGILFWILEAAIHAFWFKETSFILQLTAPTVNDGSDENQYNSNKN